MRQSSRTDDGRARRETKLQGCPILRNGVGGSLLNQGKHAGMVPNWLAVRDGSGIQASVSALCGPRGCLVPQSTRAMLDI
jgi:hypothetical protein